MIIIFFFNFVHLFDLIDKEYEEIAALKQAEDEGKRIQATKERHQQLRQLFFKQARTNRNKVNLFMSYFNLS